MTTDRDRDRSIFTWLAAEAADRAPDDLLEASRDRIRTTKQRRSRWPARRYAQMSTYAKFGAAAAAVIVVVIAGAALLGGELTAPGASQSPPPSRAPSAAVPATAAAAAALPGEFTVCVPTRNSEIKAGTNEQIADPGPGGGTIERQRGFTWGGQIESTDPRFAGTHHFSWDGDTYTLASGDPGQQAFAEGHRIENAGGSWRGSSVGIVLPDGSTVVGPAVLTGEGAYQGLTAVLLPMESPCFLGWRGLVTEVPAPPVPFTGE